MLVGRSFVSTASLSPLHLSQCLLLTLTLTAVAANAGGLYKVPNPFSKLTRNTANDFYHIEAEQLVHKNEETIEEFFSLGLGLTYSVHRELRGKTQPWALLADGRSARSYVLRSLDATTEDELDCELDHLHNHRRLFPWHFFYDVRSLEQGNPVAKNASTILDTDVGLLPELDDESGNRRRSKRKSKRRSKSLIHGIGAVWLNMIREDVRTDLVGDKSPYSRGNVWQLKSEKLEVELVFNRDKHGIPEDFETAQNLLDKSDLSLVKIRAKVRYRDSPLTEQFDSIKVKRFESGLSENDSELLQKFRTQLDLCRRANKNHRHFPNLMRALASSSERLYRVNYVMHKYNLFGMGELDGKYSDTHHRYMWPFEFTEEVFSLAHDIQTIIYDPSFMKGQELSDNGDQLDLFMSRFTDNAHGRSARHATAYYHMMMYDAETGLSCMAGEHEPKPKFRLLTSPFTFVNHHGSSYEGHVHGLGALLLNAAHLHYKSFSLFSLEIQVPLSESEFNETRSAMADVWQVYDRRDQVRALFFFERRNTSRHGPLSWNLAERDRNDFSRLIRVDLRKAFAGEDEALVIDEQTVDSDESLIAQYHVFRFEFEVPSHELEVFFDLPDECQRAEAADEDEDEDDLWNDDSDEQDSAYDGDADADDDSSTGGAIDDKHFEEDLEEEFDRLTGLEEHQAELPDFVEMLGHRTSYKFVTQIKLIEDENDEDEQREHDQTDRAKSRKSIWLSESMDLAKERLSLKLYETRESLDQDKPVEEYFIHYESELIFRLSGDGRCTRLDNGLDSKWLRLFSGHLVYYVARPTHGHKLNEQELAHNDIVVESNKLSSYGIGALWRRASETGLAEFRGIRKERAKRGGLSYKQLVWSYEELDMTMLFTFLQLDSSTTGDTQTRSKTRRAQSKPQLESVYISNQYGDEDYLLSFPEVQASVLTFDDAAEEVQLPQSCKDQLIEAERMADDGEVIRPPSPEDLLGISNVYGLRYSVFGVQSSNLQHKAIVSEWFDRKMNCGKIVIDGDNPQKKLEIFLDGSSKRMLAMSAALGKCTILTELAPTFNSLLSTLVFANNDFNSNRMHGLLGLWQLLSKREASLYVKQLNSFTEAGVSEEIYSVEMVKPSTKAEERELIRMRFGVRTPVGSSGQSSFDHRDKVRVRTRDLYLDLIEFIPISGRVNRHKLDAAAYNAIKVSEQFIEPPEDWVLPHECLALTDPPGGGGGRDQAHDTDLPVKPGETSELPVGPHEFPKLSDLFARTSRFKMQSEVSVSGNLNTLFLIDELYKGGDVRMRTRALGTNTTEKHCDLMMFLDTMNQYDLSTPLKCYRLFEDRSSNCLHMSLFDVWMQRMSRVETLASLHYGPLTMWRLAERNAASVKLIKTIEIKPDQSRDESAESYRRHMEREMNRELWQINAKDSGQAGEWSYVLEFVKHQSEMHDPATGRTLLNEWHVLESITASDHVDGQQFTVNVDIINYDYEPNSAQFEQLFLLPEGWNCRRSLTDNVEKPIELDLDVRSNVRLSYEASFEAFEGERLDYADDIELGPLRARVPESPRIKYATLVGAYLTGSDLASFAATTQLLDEGHGADSSGASAAATSGDRKRFDLSVDQTITRFADGSARSQRRVIDRQMRLLYDLNTGTGACSISPLQNPVWRMNFPALAGNELQSVLMYSSGDLSQLSDLDLFKQLFLENVDKDNQRQFFLVNKYETVDRVNNWQRVQHTSYEREFDSLRLTDDLVGPARVVRKYELPVWGQNGGDLVDGSGKPRLVSYMTARAYLLSQDKEHVRAILTVRVQVNPSANISEFLTLADVADCLAGPDLLEDRQQQRLTLEYPLVNDYDISEGRSFAPWLKESFYAQLLRPRADTRLLPMQLDGRARLEFSQHNRLLRVHFNVLEAPTAMIYFSRRFQCTMNERMEAVAEARILPSVAACSRWCDQIQCLAMSYCDDRLCRVATQAAIFGHSQGAMKKSQVERAADLISLGACGSQDSCTYYFNRLGIRTRSLHALQDHLDRVVNLRGNAEKLKALSLPLDLKRMGFMLVRDRVEPSRFYRASELFQWRRDDIEDPFELELDDESSLRNVVPRNSSADLQVRAASFALWKTASQLDINKVDLLNGQLASRSKDGDSKFIMFWAVASGQANCLQECQRNQCLLVTSCKYQNRCQMIVPTGSRSILELDLLKRELVLPNATDCTISIRDHLDKFHLFDNTHKPQRFWHKLDGYTPTECAAACQLNSPECLAFDVCSSATTSDSSPNAGNSSVCFLQRNHVTQDSFDRMVLVPTWDRVSTSTGVAGHTLKQQECAHYSRSVVAEFRRVPSVKLAELHGSSVRGISVDRCATDCLQDDSCRAFEHCQNPRRTPTQSCYLIRSAGDPDDSGKTPDNNDWLTSLAKSSSTTSMDELRSRGLREHLVMSRGCSIYVAKSELVRERLDETFEQSSVEGHSVRSLGHLKVMVPIYLLLAMLVGAVLQVAYTRTSGKTLSLRH